MDMLQDETTYKSIAASFRYWCASRVECNPRLATFCTWYEYNHKEQGFRLTEEEKTLVFNNYFHGILA